MSDPGSDPLPDVPSDSGTEAGTEASTEASAEADVGQMPAHDLDLDAIGLLCPLPVLKARKRLQSLQAGQILRLQADDPAAVIDVPHFCAEQGHHLAGITRHGAVSHYFIRKG